MTADFQRFLSLVIIDYGTGIRVAAPTSVLASMTYAARSGIIIKSGGHMERLAEVDTIVFDKTGTLTHGIPEVIDVISYQNKLSADHLLGLAVGAESRLQHPVAEALRKRAHDRGISMPLCDAPDYKVGLGVQGQVNGHYVHLGSERFLRASEIRVQQADRDRAALDERGYSCLYMAVDGQACRPDPLCRQDSPREPGGGEDPAFDGHPQHGDADRRQRDGRARGRRAYRPDAQFADMMPAGQSRGHQARCGVRATWSRWLATASTTLSR